MKSSMKFASYIIFAYNVPGNDKREETRRKEGPAMTNDHPTVLGQLSAPESNHMSHHQTESVQLTELLPVEQSRLKDNPGDKDHETTDGLKALRSFDSGETQPFEHQRESDLFEKHGVPIDAVQTTDDPASVSRKRKNNGRAKNGKLGSSTKKRRKKIADGSLEIDTSTGEIVDNSEESGDADNSVSIPDEIEDEVYDFRQQVPDPSDADRSNSDEIWSMNLEILSAGVYRDMANNFSGTGNAEAPKDSSKSTSVKKRKKQPDKRQPVKTKTSENGGKKKRSTKEKVKAKRKSTAASNPSTGDSPSVRTEPDEDLRLKVDGIIQANFYLERENNNLVRTDETAIEKRSETAIEKSAPRDNGSETESKDYSKPNGNHEETKKYNCVMCSSRFKGSGGLRNHYKVMHAAGPLYKCDECGKEFPLKERLKLHVRTHTGFKPYKCPDCPKSFARGGQLAQHRGTHTKVKPYCCNLCKGTFTCAANLALHIKRHNGQKDHKCEICGRGFVRKDALKKHLECLHRDVKSFLCVICNKTFKGHLPQHMRTHAQDRPHGCATCGQRFAQKSQLTVHQRTHSGQRPFRCLVCWQAFAHSTALKLHTRRHTGERPFKCVECNAGFTQLPHWKKHMKCIHGRTEPYSCKNCHSFFRIKNDLESHEKDCRVDDVIEDLDKTENTTVEITAEKDLPVAHDHAKFRAMSVERMRLLLAVLLKRISKPQRLDELGFGKRLIDEVLQDSLVSAGKDPSRIGELTVLESLRKNLETFLEWTVPKEHWETFRKMKKTPEDILETLTAT